MPAGRVEGRRIRVTGTVQGVGFRPWVYRLAGSLEVKGQVWNDARGVVIEAFAAASVLDDFIGRLRSEAPSAATGCQLGWEPLSASAPRDFTISPSQGAPERRISIPPDLATCEECLAELFDPRDRRYRYPFINCTRCGPRLTIAEGLPYDRPATTMAPFRMCTDCQREYEAVEDRRFHAQPNACPRCGPSLQWLDAQGVRRSGAEPLAQAAMALSDGRIVALKGLGGFHLACDATDEAAVRRLRQRKAREEKPFAVMVADLQQAQALARLSPAEAALLCGAERPIVLVPTRPTLPLAEAVAPGLTRIGVMLAYTPLHHLLLDEAKRPLVMTSGNLSDEPIACVDAEAVRRLGGIADGFLVHDRQIACRADDSVARVIAGGPVFLRRSRGYVPRPVALARPVERPVLACGGGLKSAICLAAGELAYLGPHVGDLENLETLAWFEESIDRMQRLLGVRPEVIAHDLHPGYLSTRYAQGLSGLPRIGVQHHHAHLASVMAEHRLEGPVLGLAFDGTGLGTDGSAWGGELLWATAERFVRVATTRPLGLPGGDAAIRAVWRAALSLLVDAFGAAAPVDRLELFRKVSEYELKVVRQIIEQGDRELVVPAHGIGRFFDVLGALALARPAAAYEGQLAMELEGLADPDEQGAYPYSLEIAQDPWVLDLRPTVRHAVGELLAGERPGAVSARFHGALIAAAAEWVRLAARRFGKLPVVLAGGCFQNARLAEGLFSQLGGEFALHLGRQSPPGDGGLALGQAMVADAIARKSTR